MVLMKSVCMLAKKGYQYRLLEVFLNLPHMTCILLLYQSILLHTQNILLVPSSLKAHPLK